MLVSIDRTFIFCFTVLFEEYLLIALDENPL